MFCMAGMPPKISEVQANLISRFSLRFRIIEALITALSESSPLNVGKQAAAAALALA